MGIRPFNTIPMGHRQETRDVPVVQLGLEPCQSNLKEVLREGIR